MTVPAPTPRPDDEPDDRPKSFETMDGDLVFYDKSNTEAWIQSSITIDLEEVRTTGLA
jgi:hypothetical protein